MNVQTNLPDPSVVGVHEAIVFPPKVRLMVWPAAKLVPVAVRLRPTGPLEAVNARAGVTSNSPTAVLPEPSTAVTVGAPADAEGTLNVQLNDPSAAVVSEPAVQLVISVELNLRVTAWLPFRQPLPTVAVVEVPVGPLFGVSVTIPFTHDAAGGGGLALLEEEDESAAGPPAEVLRELETIVPSRAGLEDEEAAEEVDATETEEEIEIAELERVGLVEVGATDAGVEVVGVAAELPDADRLPPKTKPPAERVSPKTTKIVSASVHQDVSRRATMARVGPARPYINPPVCRGELYCGGR